MKLADLMPFRGPFVGLGSGVPTPSGSDGPFRPFGISRCFLDVPWAYALILTHISEHTRLEIPMDLRDLRAFSPPLPE